MYYFAYGSNLYSKRLIARLNQVERLGTRLLPEHRLCFHKVGWRDGSAKCDAHRTNNNEDFMYGVLYEIMAEQLPILDEIEGVGHGYERHEVQLYLPATDPPHIGSDLTPQSGLAGTPAETAFTYIATLIDAELRPYDWYVNHVVKGAYEAGFPQNYIDTILQVVSISDNDQQRAEQEWGIHQHK